MASEFEPYSFPQRYTDADYAGMIVGLLPKGVIWGVEQLLYALTWQDEATGGDADYADTTDAERVIQDSVDGGFSGSKLGLLLSCFASELARVEGDAWRVLNETDPGVAVETLEDWERVLALPSPCTTTALSVDDRQRVAHAKLFVASRVPTLTWYSDYAASLGFTATANEDVSEYRDSVCGVARCGVARCVGSYYAKNSVIRVTVTEGDGDLELLRCGYAQTVPAHVVVDIVDSRVGYGIVYGVGYL